MKILITNDDGIFAEGIKVMASWAKSLGEVTVIAPKQEQSAKSHGIEIHNPYEIREVDLIPGVRAISLDSTPADCVRYAAWGLGLSFDLVLSGVNRGFNLGADIVYSATCGGIFEAAYCNTPAMAISTDPASFESAEKNLDTVYDFIMRNHLFSYSQLYNVNIPLEPRGIRVTKQGGIYFRDRFLPEPEGENLYRAHGFRYHENGGDLTLDTDAVMSGYLSVTPLTVSRTNYEAYEKLAEMNLNT